MSRFRLDCEFCEETVRASELTELKNRAVSHLEGEHEVRLRAVFSDVFGGEPCRNECGHIFSTDVDEVSGFDCPECGHDNFDPFVRRYLYWRIESASDGSP